MRNGQHAIERLKRLFGKDFRCCRDSPSPVCHRIQPSLAEQGALTAADPWRVNGWLTQAARSAKAGSFRCGPFRARGVARTIRGGRLKVVQFPHRAKTKSGRIAGGLVEDDGKPFDPKQVPRIARLPGGKAGHAVSRH